MEFNLFSRFRWYQHWLLSRKFCRKDVFDWLVFLLQDFISQCWSDCQCQIV